MLIAYVAGGGATAITMPLVGWLSDHMDRLRLLTLMSAAAVVVVLACETMALFMVTMPGRFAPAMAMIANSVESRYRGGFMSVNSALQQASIGFANVLAGFFVTREASGHFAGMPQLGCVSIAFLVLTVVLAALLRSTAPHVSAPEQKSQSSIVPTPTGAFV